MCTVQIYDAERWFVNEIPVRTTLEGAQYADDLAKESPARGFMLYWTSTAARFTRGECLCIVMRKNRSA